MEERTFSDDDQRLFAELSGDRNSLHVNALEARRTLFGRQIVHGMHLLLWSLETLLPRPSRLTALTVSFGRPVGIGEAVSCRVTRIDGHAMTIVLESRGATSASIDVEVDDLTAPGPVVPGTPPETTARVMEPAELGDARGELDLFYDHETYRWLCGGRESRLPADQVALLMASTRLVGTECPGAHSIYSELTLTFQAGSPAQARPAMAWRVAAFDPRFSRVVMKVDGPGCTGTVIALLRPRPQAQLSFSDVRLRVPAGLFSDQTALVVGGSRGAGEVCAKILAAGGARVHLTYHRGATEAEAIIHEIRSGGAVATAFAFDVLQPRDLATAFMDRCPSHGYYFATPPIFVASKQQYAHEIFAIFYEIYVRGLLNTYQALRAVSSGDLDLYYPSSVAVTDIQTNMGEYAAAKAAGETVCRYLQAKDRKLRVRIDRLPRLPTDQTASVMDVHTADIIDVILKALTNVSGMRIDATTGQLVASA